MKCSELVAAQMEEETHSCVERQSLQTIVVKLIFSCMHTSLSFTDDLAIPVC